MIRHILLLAVGLLFLLYGGVIHGVHSGTRFFAVWFLLGAACVGLALCGFFHVWDRLPAALVRSLQIGAVLALALLAGTAVAILAGGRGTDRPCDTIIVLGAQVNSGGPSVVLRYRLDAAADYLLAHPQTSCVVSGGQGYNEPCTEAEAMSRYLAERGIDPGRIHQEPEATSTLENLEFSKAYCDPLRSRVGIVTNQFHMLRSVLLARKLGYEEVVPIPAGSIPLYLPNNVLRECLALWKDLLAGNLV